jgi:uncharacterized protein YbjT (DUF2867 family)
MASTNSNSSGKPIRVVVFGGTGAQGRPVVERGLSNRNSKDLLIDRHPMLAASDRYQVSLLTRDASNPKVRALAYAYDNVHLITGSYTTESGLCAALKDQDACYFNIDRFSIGEAQEYFWTFRAYE